MFAFSPFALPHFCARIDQIMITWISLFIPANHDISPPAPNPPLAFGRTVNPFVFLGVMPGPFDDL